MKYILLQCGRRVYYLLKSFCLRQRIVAEDIMFPEYSCVRACVSPEQTLLARYLGYLLTEFDQMFTTNRLWSKDMRFKFWGQKITVGSNSA